VHVDRQLHDGAPLVDVRTVRQELSLPPKLTFGQIKGFTLLPRGRSCQAEGGDRRARETKLRELAVG
jgi:pyruvate dehydrogenase (quinone)